MLPFLLIGLLKKNKFKIGLKYIVSLIKNIKKKFLQKFFKKIRVSPGVPTQQNPLNLPLPFPIREFLTFLKNFKIKNFSKRPLIFFFLSCLKIVFNFKKNLLYCLKKKKIGDLTVNLAPILNSFLKK